MTTAIYNANNLPCFLAGVNSEFDHEYIIHCHAPRFIGRVDAGAGSIKIEQLEWIDPAPEDWKESVRLLREAGDWWAKEDSALGEN